MSVEFHQPQEQIAQSCHNESTTPAADTRGVLTQAHIAAVMGAVLTGSPVVTNNLEQLPGAVLLGGCAGAVKSVFFGGLDYFAPAQFLAFSPHGQKLPATA
jgi:hypothetical protein